MYNSSSGCTPKKEKRKVRSMKKRWLALLLTLVMLLSLSVPALAAEEVRETDFFEDREHGDVNFEDMEYIPVDIEADLAAMDATRALVEDAANIDAVREGFLAACDMYTNALTMYTLAKLYYAQDFAGEGNADRMSVALQAAMDAQDGLYALGRDILNSPCAAALDGIVNEEDAEYLRDYEDMTEEEKALEVEITGLEDEYQNAAYEEYAAEWNGATWTEDAVVEAFYADEISYDDAIYLLYTAIPAAKNAVLGEIYLRIVDAHQREAAMEDYEFYDDYAYENVYGRDYTPLEIREFHGAVKENIGPLYNLALGMIREMLDEDVYYGDFTGDIALDIMDPYIAAMSGELYESFTYMREHGLYDSGLSDTKDGTGFTATLPAYGAPFFFNTPTETFYDMTTAVHEFGHYNNAYWMDDGWYHGSKDYDTDEVHSQALELFFAEFYPEILGDGAGDFAKLYVLFEKIAAVVDGALYDELQQFVYETEGVTLDQINEKYTELCHEYGVIDPEETETQYDWVDIPHTFTSPCYYISYATSAVGALEFWMKAQEDYFTAVDDYLRFTAQKMDEYSFQEGLEALGYPSPISAEYIADLAEELTAVFNSYLAPSAADYFTDVNGDESWYEAVDTLYSYGYLNGVAEGVLDPDGTMTRAQASTMLCRLFDLTESYGSDYFSDVTEGHWYTDMVNAAYENELIHGFPDGTFRPGDSMSRQDFAVILYNIFEMIGSGFSDTWSFDLGAADADQIGGYALEAVSWGVMNGYFNPDENACLRPADALTRAEMAEMVYGFLLVLG